MQAMGLEIGVVFGVLAAISAIAFYAGKLHERRWWRWEMVERRYAMYHFYDGKWYWNENVPKSQDPITRGVAKYMGKNGLNS